MFTHFNDFSDDFFHGNLSINLRFDTQRNARSHYEQKPWKDEVSKMQPIPYCMLNPPVVPAAGVDEDHQHNCNASKDVETLQSFLCSLHVKFIISRLLVYVNGGLRAWRSKIKLVHTLADPVESDEHDGDKENS